MMWGYGEFIWNQDKKYCGFYKNDKKDGFGIFKTKGNKFFVGFWKEGKQEGIGKYFIDNNIRYGIWKNGKRENEIFSEEEFISRFNSNEAKYINVFQWNLEKIKNFMNT